MRLLILFFLIFLNSCVSTFDKEFQDSDSTLKSDVSWATKMAEQQMVSPDCASPQIPSKTIEGLIFNVQTCGLLSDDLPKLKKEICPALKLARKACEKTVKEAYFARLGARYPKVSPDDLENRCKAYPLDCPDLRKTEITLLTMQNDIVQSEFNRARENAITRWRERGVQIETDMEEDRRTRISGAMHAISDGFKPQPAQCSGFKPMPPYGCSVVCINGVWSNVCK